MEEKVKEEEENATEKLAKRTQKRKKPKKSREEKGEGRLEVPGAQSVTCTLIG